MKAQKSLPTILIAEDDSDDRIWIKEALAECKITSGVQFVVDGEDLMDYLHHRGRYISASSLSYPGLILLDLNMPKKDGRAALKEIKEDPRLRHIPIVILTTSTAQEDTFKTYNMGANSVIHKPVTFENLVKIMRMVTSYWFDISELPI